MKKRYHIIIPLFFCLSKFSTAQILCIYCYDQNYPISAGVNNLVLNGGFENTTCFPDSFYYSCFCPNSTNYSCDIANWTSIGGGTNTYADIVDTNFTQIIEGNLAAYFGNMSAYPCSISYGDTFCINNILCTATGIPVGYPTSLPNYGGVLGVSLEQTITGMVVGNIYVLEFWAGGESFNGQFTEKGLFAVDVGFGDTLLRDKPTPPVSGIGTRYIIEFNATSSSHTIKFTNWGHLSSVSTELVLDDVRLYTQAELSASVPHCTLGIDDAFASGSEIIISPNPVTNELNVNTNSNELSEIIFYDASSRVLLRQKFTNSVSLNTAQLAKGLYLYEVRNKDGSCKQGKVVKD